MMKVVIVGILIYLLVVEIREGKVSDLRRARRNKTGKRRVKVKRRG